MMDTLEVIREAFGEASMYHTRKVQTQRDRKKGETGEEQKVKSMLMFFISRELSTEKRRENFAVYR
jgi:hypothetical protein